MFLRHTSFLVAAFMATPLFAQSVDFNAVDLNGDGTIVMDEFLVLQEAAFFELDTTGDGVLDVAEITQAITRAGLPKRGVKKAMTRDADGDGVLNINEFLSQSPAFAKADRNKDGGLQYGEYAQVNEYLLTAK